MTAAPVRLLLLEDYRADTELLQAALAEFAPGDFAITHVERLADALARIRTGQFDVLLCDLGLPDSAGLATVQALAAWAPALPLVVLTGFDDDELGRAAIRHGAQDYLVKGETSGALMGRILRYAIERKRLEIGLRAANEALAGRVAERTAELDAANAILLANAAGYRQLFDANPHPMYMFDPETLRLLAVNDAAVAHYGWSREEFLAMTIADIRPAAEIQRLRDHIARVQREDIGQGSFWKHRKKDGTLIDVEISAHAIEFGGRRARVALAHDITERRRAEEALRESEARFRSLTEMSSDFYWETDVEHRLTRGNSAANLSVQSVWRTQIGKRRWDTPYLSPDEAGWQAHRAVLEAHRPFREFELSRLGPDGTEHHLSVSGDPIFDASGAFEGYRGVGSDISERKRAEQALREHELRLRLAQELGHIGVWDRIVATGEENFSDELNRIYGLTPGAIRTYRDWLSRVHPDDVGRMEAERDAAIARRETFDVEFRIFHSSGEVRWISGLGGAEYDHEGRMSRVVGVNIDITERKQAEETQAKLAAIVESSNDAIISRALDGTVTSWNAAAERILGYTAAETIGRDPVEIVPPRLRQQLVENRKLIWAGQMVASHETVRIAKNGRHIDFAVSVSAIKDNGGRVIGTATTLRDITERKRTEQALHDNAKRLRGLSRRLIAIEETARRNINRELHDRVGQNLAALNINLNIIRSQLPQQSRDAVGARLQDTQTLLEGMAAQVRDVMADLHPPALDDYGLLAALRTYVESLGARFAVPISVHGEDLAPRLPLVAETALFRIAQGALANAAAHARATRVQVVLAATPDRVTLTIADDGAGFDVAHAALAHASWGLAIMRERAEAVGAALRIDTAPGRGTRVVVEIEPEAA